MVTSVRKRAYRLGIKRTYVPAGHVHRKRRTDKQLLRIIHGPYGAYRRCIYFKNSLGIPRGSAALRCGTYHRTHWSRNATAASRRPTMPHINVLHQLADEYNSYARQHGMRILRRAPKRGGRRTSQESKHPHYKSGPKKGQFKPKGR